MRRESLNGPPIFLPLQSCGIVRRNDCTAPETCAGKLRLCNGLRYGAGAGIGGRSGNCPAERPVQLFRYGGKIATGGASRDVLDVLERSAARQKNGGVARAARCQIAECRITGNNPALENELRIAPPPSSFANEPGFA